LPPPLPFPTRRSSDLYKRESFALFQDLLESIKRDAIRVLSHVQVRREDPVEEEARLRREAEELAQRMQFQHAEVSALDEPNAEPDRKSTRLNSSHVKI